MADFIALRAGSWLTIKAIQGLIEHFTRGAGDAVVEWVQRLMEITRNQETRSVEGSTSLSLFAEPSVPLDQWNRYRSS